MNIRHDSETIEAGTPDVRLEVACDRLCDGVRKISLASRKVSIFREELNEKQR